MCDFRPFTPSPPITKHTIPEHLLCADTQEQGRQRSCPQGLHKHTCSTMSGTAECNKVKRNGLRAWGRQKLGLQLWWPGKAALGRPHRSRDLVVARRSDRWRSGERAFPRGRQVVQRPWAASSLRSVFKEQEQSLYDWRGMSQGERARDEGRGILSSRPFRVLCAMGRTWTFTLSEMDAVGESRADKGCDLT